MNLNEKEKQAGAPSLPTGAAAGVGLVGLAIAALGTLIGYVWVWSLLTELLPCPLVIAIALVFTGGVMVSGALAHSREE